MQIVRLPPDNTMNELDHSDQKIDRSALKDLDHEVGIDDLSEV